MHRPFSGLQGVLTLIALLTATVVLIGQRRQTRLSEQRAHLDLQINLITEQKVTKLIHLIEELRQDLPMVRDRHDPHAWCCRSRPMRGGCCRRSRTQDSPASRGRGTRTLSRRRHARTVQPVGPQRAKTGAD